MNKSILIATAFLITSCGGYNNGYNKGYRQAQTEGPQVEKVIINERIINENPSMYHTDRMPDRMHNSETEKVIILDNGKTHKHSGARVHAPSIERAIVNTNESVSRQAADRATAIK